MKWAFVLLPCRLSTLNCLQLESSGHCVPTSYLLSWTISSFLILDDPWVRLSCSNFFLGPWFHNLVNMGLAQCSLKSGFYDQRPGEKINNRKIRHQRCKAISRNQEIWRSRWAEDQRQCWQQKGLSKWGSFFASSQKHGINPSMSSLGLVGRMR